MTDLLNRYDTLKADYPQLFFSFDVKDRNGNVLKNVDDNPLSFYTKEKLQTLLEQTTDPAAITFYSHYKNYDSNIYYTIYNPQTAKIPKITLSGADNGGLKAQYFKEFQEIEEKKRKEEERDLKIKALEQKFDNRRQLFTLAGIVIQKLLQHNAAPIARRLSGITGGALKTDFFHAFLSPDADIPQDLHDLSQRFRVLPPDKQQHFKNVITEQLNILENE